MPRSPYPLLHPPSRPPPVRILDSIRTARSCAPFLRITGRSATAAAIPLYCRAMRYRRFGRTGFSASDIAQGLWGMGGWSGSDDAESLGAIQLAVDSGCTFFDTAWAYGDGKSDTLLGEIVSRDANREKRLICA